MLKEIAINSKYVKSTIWRGQLCGCSEERTYMEKIRGESEQTGMD